jgi:hypothetical protein
MNSTHVLLILGLAALTPASVAGQTSDRLDSVAERFEALKGRLERGQRLVVTTTDGRQVRGRFESIDASSLTVHAGGKVREFRQTDVREFRRRGDRLWDGALWGMGGGALSGALIARDRPGCGGEEALCAGLGLAVGVPIGAVVGMMIDALRPHNDLLFSRSQAQSRQWLLVPTVGDKAYGLHLVTSF